jgi:hypothetical protein
MVFLKIGGLREIKDVLRNFGLGVSKEQLMGIYNYSTDEKFGFILLDLEANTDKKFRKGFNEYLDPSDFGPDEE